MPYLDELYRLSENVDLVSFDFFDTLFLRPLCDPEDLFDLMGARLGYADFRTRRQLAQRHAFDRMIEQGRREITLADIYAHLHYPGINAAELMQMESALELALLKPNPGLINFYQELLAQNKQVVILSDMYLSAQFFKACLQRHQLPQVPIFVSSECNATKRDQGDLFTYVSEHTQVKASRILHIGDNPNADVKQARHKGWQTFLYQELDKPKPIVGRSVMASLARGLWRTHASLFAANSFQAFGYRYAGPAAVGFLAWISEQAKKDHIDRLFFLSRDGYILHRLAPLLAFDLPRSDYLYGSRVAFTMASISEENYLHHLPFLISGAQGLSANEMLERIGVPVPALEVMSAFGLGDQVRFSSTNQDKFIQFLWSYRWEVCKVARRNRRLMFQYLKTLGVEDGQRIGIIDVGWNGTTQEALERVIAEMFETRIHGYYFSLTDSAICQTRRQTYNMTAMLEATTAKNTFGLDLYRERMLIELCFSAPHDCVIGWEEGINEIVPIQDRGRRAMEDLTGHIDEIIAGAEIFAKSLNEIYEAVGLSHTAINPLDIAWPLLAYIQEDTWRKLPLLKSIKNFDAWSSSRHHDTYLAKYDY